MALSGTEKMRRYREKHRDKYNAYQREWRKRYYKENSEHVREIDKISRIKRYLKEKENENEQNRTSLNTLKG